MIDDIKISLQDNGRRELEDRSGAKKGEGAQHDKGAA